MLKLRYNLSVLHHDNRRPFMISKISGFTNTKQFVHFYSTGDAVKELYKDRLAPVKPFTDKVILSVSNILDVAQRREFFLQLKGKGGGIYIFQYKHDPLVYYIGRTTQFENRLRSHINHKLSDKFHVFGNLVGWDNFTISIVEFCEKEDLGIRENYYLQKYLPLLNSTFSSKLSETVIFETLTSKLKNLKLNNNIPDTCDYSGFDIWVYNLLSTQIDPSFVRYSSLNKASRELRIGRQTLTQYLDSNVPYNGLLFFSKPLEDLDTSFKLATQAKYELNLDSTQAKPVWVYTVSNNKVELVNNEPFISRGKAALFLGTSHNVVRYYMDCWRGKGFNGYYLFSKPLTDKELDSLLELYLSDSMPGKVKVWAYSAKTLELINNSAFNTLKEAGSYFNVKYTTIAKHLDTELSTKLGGDFVYLFSKEISEEIRNKLQNNMNKANPPDWC